MTHHERVTLHNCVKDGFHRRTPSTVRNATHRSARGGRFRPSMQAKGRDNTSPQFAPPIMDRFFYFSTTRNSFRERVRNVGRVRPACSTKSMPPAKNVGTRCAPTWPHHGLIRSGVSNRHTLLAPDDVVAVNSSLVPVIGAGDAAHAIIAEAMICGYTTRERRHT
jgi:hypothetical protein